MSQLDIAKLRRVRASVSALVVRSEINEMAAGLPDAYMALRAEVLKVLPIGLVEEVEAICPEVPNQGGRRDIIMVKLSADRARAFLVALDGWLDAVIQT